MTAVLDLAPEKLPPFADPAAIVRQGAERLRTPSRMSVSEAAAAYRYVYNPGGGYSGPWKNETVPYMVEPADMITSRRHRGVVFVGPAQSAKTDALIVNAVVHAVVCDPADMLIVQTNEVMARDFSRRRIERLNRHSEAVGERLTGGDNVFDKLYRGMMLNLGFPSISQLSGRPLPRVLLTDYDRMPDDVGGEGSPFDLAMKRTQTFGSRAITVAESSPGRTQADPRWKPETPHQAPPASGILALYNRGDRRRFHWPCPECGEYFEGHFGLLDWPKAAEAAGDVAEAAAQVVMVCPHHGCVIPPSAKARMLAVGVWVPEGQSVDVDGYLHGEARRSDIASYWLKGPAAAFQTWPQLVTKYLDAKAELAATGDEQPLKATVNTDQAEAYIPLAAAAGEAVEAGELVERAESYPLKVVPEGARFLTQSVDVQANRFEVMVWAWGEGLESWVVDRFELFKAAGEDRPIAPASKSEDWDLLEPLLAAVYPLAGRPGRAMRVLRTAIDSGGAAGTTAQAYAFFRRMRRKGLARRAVLVKGTGAPAAPRVALTYPDSRRKDRKAGARGEVPVALFQTDLLKDELDARLRRAEPGPRYVHLSAALKDKAPPHAFFEQLTAEERNEQGRWKKVKARNEALDLAVMAHVAALTLQAERVDWSAPPAWAAAWDENEMVFDPDGDEGRSEASAPKAQSRPAKRSRPRRRGGWVNSW